MPSGADLEGEARAFAGRLSRLLNRTVTHGVRLGAVLDPQQGIVRVGRGITRTSFTPQPVPLSLAAAAPRAWLLVAYLLDLDPERRHLAVVKSECSLYLDEGLDEPIVRYEYAREPSNDFPAAHLQIHGASECMVRLCERASIRRELHRFHFPVGGRRYRPSVEDVIEFLAVEELVQARPGWQEVVEVERGEFHRLQLLTTYDATPRLLGRRSTSSAGASCRRTTHDQPKVSAEHGRRRTAARVSAVSVKGQRKTGA